MRKTVTGVSLAAFLALGAVACGSSSSSSGNNGALDPSGGSSATPSATASASPAASASASASTTAADGVQSFPFPTDVKVVFQTPLPASGPKRGAMIGYENYVDSVYYASQTQGKNTAYLKYVSGNVLTGSNRLINDFKSNDVTLHGTVYYYDMSVTQVFGSGGAVVQACVDSSGLHVLQSDGKVGGQVFSTPRYLEQSSAGKTKAGYWMIGHTVSTSANSGGSAEMCI
jgi:hypothetical protein